MYNYTQGMYNFSQMFNVTSYKDFLLGGALGAFIVVLGIALLLILAAFYVYHALAWVKIAKRMKHKHPWLAWIPFASTAMRLQLGGFRWGWVFLYLIPIAGWIALIVMLTIANWRIFKKNRYPAWLSLSFPAMFVPHIGFIGFVVYFVSIGIVAWRRK